MTRCGGRSPVIALERLISDGRIHPARIEEMVEKATPRGGRHHQAGRRARRARNRRPRHPSGAGASCWAGLRYRTSYGQNVLNHSMEVAHPGRASWPPSWVADVTLAKRAGLLHDIGKAIDHEVEGSHVDIGVDMAKKYQENPKL